MRTELGPERVYHWEYARSSHRFAQFGEKSVRVTGSTPGAPSDTNVLARRTCAALGAREARDVAMPSELVRACLHEMERLDISAIWESAEINVSLDRGDNWFPNAVVVTTAAEVEAARPDLRFSKAVFHNHELEKFFSSDILRDNLVLFQLGDGMNEVTVKGIDKGAGLLAYVEALEEPPARTYAFGDSENDLPMLRVADTGVVMGNARPDIIERVRELGGYVTDPVLEDGVATALEHFGLI